MRLRTRLEIYPPGAIQSHLHANLTEAIIAANTKPHLSRFISIDLEASRGFQSPTESAVVSTQQI